MSRDKLLICALSAITLVYFFAGVFQTITDISLLPLAALGIGWFILAVFSLERRFPAFMAATVLSGIYFIYKYQIGDISGKVAAGLLLIWAVSYLFAAQTYKGDLWGVTMVGVTVLLIEQAVFSVNLWAEIAILIVLLAVGQGIIRCAAQPSRSWVFLILFMCIPLSIIVLFPKVYEAASPININKVMQYSGDQDMEFNQGEDAPELPLFTVTSDQPSYWRGKVFDYYDGNSWFTTDQTYGEIEPQYLEKIQGKLLVQSVTLYADAKFLPAAYQVTEISDQTVQIDAAAALLKTTKGKYTYQVSSILPDLTKVSPASREVSVVEEKYLQIPERFSKDITDLTKEVTAKGANNWEKTILIRNFLRNEFKYNTGVQLDESDMLSKFLFDEKKGYCVHFATAMVMMARSAGVPARWVLGFTPGTYDEDMNAYLVYSQNAHTWAEVYVPGNGWLPVEATPGFVLPNGGETEKQVEPGNMFGNAFTLTQHKSLYLVFIGAAIALLLIFLNRRNKRKDKLQIGSHWSGLGLYGEILKWFGKRGVVPEKYETPREFTQRVGKDFPETQSLLQAVAEGFMSWRYGNKEINQQEEQELTRKWKQWRHR